MSTLHKRENVIVDREGRPNLIDFQVSLGVGARWPWNGGLFRRLVALLQETDTYHVRKHHVRLYPEEFTPEARETYAASRHHRRASARRETLPALARALLARLRVRDRSGMAHSEHEPEVAFRRDDGAGEGALRTQRHSAGAAAARARTRSVKTRGDLLRLRARRPARVGVVGTDPRRPSICRPQRGLGRARCDRDPSPISRAIWKNGCSVMPSIETLRRAGPRRAAPNRESARAEGRRVPAENGRWPALSRDESAKYPCRGPIAQNAPCG